MYKVAYCNLYEFNFSAFFWCTNVSNTSVQECLSENLFSWANMHPKVVHGHWSICQLGHGRRNGVTASRGMRAVCREALTGMARRRLPAALICCVYPGFNKAGQAEWRPATLTGLLPSNYKMLRYCSSAVWLQTLQWMLCGKRPALLFQNSPHSLVMWWCLADVWIIIITASFNHAADDTS